MTRPYLVGIAGGSCSGKTHFCDHLQAALKSKGIRCTAIALDSFYLDRSGITETDRWQLNFDHPDALDWDAITVFLRSLRKSAPTETLYTPTYDFASHTRTGALQEVSAADVYIIEGLYALLPRTELPYQLSVFIDCHESLTLYRRLGRDAADRGRPQEQTLAQYYENVLPMYRQHIRPTRQNAHFTVEWVATQPKVIDHLSSMIISQL